MISFRDLGEHTKYPVTGPKPQNPGMETARLLKQRGWVEITAPLLGTNIYLIADPQKHPGRHFDIPPNTDLPQYTLAEIEALNGLSPDQIKFLHQQKADFGGTISAPISYAGGWRKVFPVKGEPYWQKAGKTISSKNK